MNEPLKHRGAEREGSIPLPGNKGKLSGINGESNYLFRHTEEFPRCGEGSAVVLKDGTVLLVCSRFERGGEDHDRAELWGGPLNGQGVWHPGRIFHPAPGALNQMSVSLERLQDGGIGMVWLRKTASDRDDVYFSQSRDEGQTWSEPVRVNRGDPAVYFVVNNDRLRQFASGRLAIPVARNTAGGSCGRPDLSMFYSDDNGLSWQRSSDLNLAEVMPVAPHRLLPAQEAVWDEIRAEPACQEPGVEELADGRILYYCRTTMGFMYRAWSEDGGGTWSGLEAATDLVSPCSPQSIRRLPGSKRMICAYNDRSAVSFCDNDAQWHWRTPLRLAFSDDDGVHWTTVAGLEDDTHNQCYTGICFTKESALLTYYESENTVADGVEQRRNLASLRLLRIPMTTLHGIA